MTFFPSSTTWKARLKVGQIDKKYTVKLKRDLGCCKKYSLEVNNENVTNNLPMYLCSPFYKLKGEFGWEMDNSHFLLVRDSLLFALCSKKHRLFVNQFDVESGVEFSEFWRQRGWQHFFVGVCTLSLAIGMAVISSYVENTGPMLAASAIMFIFGATIFGFGIFLIIYKHRNPEDLYTVDGIDNIAVEEESEQQTSC